MLRTRSVAFISAALTLVACSSGGDASSTSGAGGASTATNGTGGHHPSASSGSGAGGPTPVPCDGDPAQLSLSGTWAAIGELSTGLVGAPGGAVTICPANQPGQSSLILMLQVEQDTTDPTSITSVKATLCSIALPVVKALVGQCDPHSTNLISTQLIVPQKLLDALPGIATAPVTGTLDGATKGANMSLDRFTVTVGSTVPGAQMPTWDTVSSACSASNIGNTATCDAACVSSCTDLSDDDADGFPGVTVDVCGYSPSDTQNGVVCDPTNPGNSGSVLQGHAAIDIQVDPQFTGQAVSSCELSGNVDTGVLYNVVGADVTLTGAPIAVTSAILSLPSFHVDPSKSKFRMVRIDGQFGAPDLQVDPTQPQASCTTIIQKKNLL